MKELLFTKINSRGAQLPGVPGVRNFGTLKQMGKSLKNLLLILLFILSGSIVNEIKAQYCIAASSNSAIVPTGVLQTVGSYTTGSPAFNFSANVGCTYYFSTCGLAGSNDTYLRLYSTGTGGSVLAFSDDFCGLESQITWLCPGSGVYSILLTEYSCVSLSFSSDMSYSVSCPPACAGTPNSGTGVISASVGCPGAAFNLNASGTTTGVTGMSYQWQSSASGSGPWSSIASGTTINFATSTPTTTYYQLVSTCSNSSLSATSSVVSYSVVNPGPCVCNAYGFSGATSGGDEEITRVTFGSMTNLSTCTSVGPGPGSIMNMYSNYTGFVAAPAVCKGQAVPFSASITTCGGWYGMALRVYIDYNQNGSFLDAGEQVYNLAYNSFLQGNNTTTITIPQTALAGTTRMRVIAVEGTIPGPTGSYTWGETEDYCITILPNPTIVLSSNSGTICPGGSHTVTATGANTYTISGGPNTLAGSSATLSPLISSTYTFAGTDGLGCISTGSNGTTASVTTLAAPQLTIVATPTAVCPGFTTALTVSGANTYTWTGLTTGSQVVVSPTSTSVYTVSGTGTNVCNGVNNISVPVNPNPTITVNSGTLCAGSVFTMVPGGAFTYTFTGGSNTVSPSGDTSYSVTGTSAAGCVASNTAVSSLSVFALPVVTASSGTICSGASYSIQTSGALSYTVVGASNPVSPTVTTSYSVVGSNSLGCVSIPAVSDVTVYALPSITIAATPATSICNTSTVNLAASGAVTYTWNNTTPGVSITRTPSVTTTYFVIGTDANSCSNVSVVQVTVNPLPNVGATGNVAFVCVGGSATLTAFGSGNYTWSPGGTTVTPNPVNPVVSTVYSVTSSNAFGCTKTATVAVAVNTIVMTISSNTSVCEGYSVDLSVGGMNTQQWSNGSTFSQINVSPSVTTLYTVSGVDSKNCSHSGAVTVTVNANPVVTSVVSPDSICAGEEATLTASGASSYSWGTVGAGATVTISPLTSGTLMYIVTGTGSNGCYANDTTSINVQKCVGLNELATGISGLSIYPNPHVGEFTVELSGGTKTIEVSDVSGRIILTEQSVDDKTLVNLKSFANGVYYVKITSGKDSEVVKVIKQ